MLTIKEPLKLYSLNIMNINTSSFAEKINGNYALFRLQIGSEDLLHMTMEPPEIYLEEGGPGVTLNQMKINVINHFLNRIQCLSDTDFTYQDMVYLSVILRRLGIRDVQDFVARAQSQQKKNGMAAGLKMLYLENGREIREAVRYFKEAVRERELQDSQTKEDKRGTTQETGRYFLQNQIYERIETAQLNNYVYAFQMGVQSYYQETTNRELLLTEQIRMADEIQLTQLRSYMAITEYPPMHQFYNYYEMQPETYAGQDKRQMGAQIAAAILMQLTDLVQYSIMQRTSGQSRKWMELNQSVCGSVQTVLHRMEMYYSRENLMQRADNQYTEHINQLYEYEHYLMTAFEAYRTGEKDDKVSLGQIVGCFLQSEKLETALFEVTASAPGRQSTVLYDKADYEVIIELQKQMKEYAVVQETSTETLTGQIKTALDYPAADVGETEAGVQPYAEAFPAEYKEQGEDTQLLLMQFEQMAADSAQEGELSQEQADIYLKQFLDKVNEKNVEFRSQLKEHTKKQQISPNVVIDRAAAKALSIRALENQTEVLAEVMKNAVPVKQREQEEINQLLSLADVETRQLYENILHYREDASLEPDGVRAITQAELREFLKPEVIHPAENPGHNVDEPGRLQKMYREDNQIRRGQMPPGMEKEFFQTQLELFKTTLEKTDYIESYSAEQTRWHVPHVLHEQKESGAERTVPQAETVNRVLTESETFGRVAEPELFSRIAGAEIIDRLRTQEVPDAEKVITAAEMLSRSLSELERVNTLTEPDADRTGPDAETVITAAEMLNRAPTESERVKALTEPGTDRTVPQAETVTATAGVGQIRSGLEKANVRTEPESAPISRNREESSLTEILSKVERELSIPAGQIQEDAEPAGEIALIYKNTVNGLDEEVLEELRQRQHKGSVTERTVEEGRFTTTVLPAAVTEAGQNIEVKNEETITGIVSRDIQSRINSISDQVYQKLERRLENERRRRGY